MGSAHTACAAPSLTRWVEGVWSSTPALGAAGLYLSWGSRSVAELERAPEPEWLSQHLLAYGSTQGTLYHSAHGQATLFPISTTGKFSRVFTHFIRSLHWWMSSTRTWCSDGEHAVSKYTHQSIFNVIFLKLMFLSWLYLWEIYTEIFGVMGIKLGFGFTSLQANRLACWFVTGSNRRHKISGSVTKEFIPHGMGSCMKIICVCSPFPQSPEGATQRVQMAPAQWRATQRATLNLGNLLLHSKP